MALLGASHTCHVPFSPVIACFMCWQFPRVMWRDYFWFTIFASLVLLDTLGVNFGASMSLASEGWELPTTVHTRGYWKNGKRPFFSECTISLTAIFGRSCFNTAGVPKLESVTHYLCLWNIRWVCKLKLKNLFRFPYSSFSTSFSFSDKWSNIALCSWAAFLPLQRDPIPARSRTLCSN